MEKIKALFSSWLDANPGRRDRWNVFVFRIKAFVIFTVVMIIAWYGFLFYLDRPMDHAVKIDISKPAEAIAAPEVVLGDDHRPKTTTGAKPQLPTATSTPLLPTDVAAVTAAPIASAATPSAPPPPLPAAAVEEKSTIKTPAVKVTVQAKAKFPKGVNSKKALEFFKKKIETENECFAGAPAGQKQLTVLVKTAPNGTVLAVTLKPTAVKEKRKIASVVKEWTPTSVCLKKHLDKSPFLKNKGKKSTVSEMILKLE